MWTTFYFDGNMAWGLVDSPAEWERIKEAYRTAPGGHATPSDLLDAKNCPNRREGLPPLFGFVIECNGPQTLREFFAEHGMEGGTR